MRTYQVNVRLTRQERDALRRVPGDTDAARLRSLIHARALVNVVAEQVDLDGEKTRQLIVELSRRLQVWADAQGEAK